VNFSSFEKRIDRRGNLDDVVVSPQPIDECPEIGKQNP
jgi:hypothetical protein